MSLTLIAAAMLAPAPTPESPRAFVERVYAGYRNPDYSPLAHPGAVFEAPLVAAIAEDARLSHDEVGYMDADPLCQCQDPSGLRPVIRDVRQPSPVKATARLLLRFGASDDRPVILHLVRTRFGWRIADVASSDDPSLLASLQRFNRRRR